MITPLGKRIAIRRLPERQEGVIQKPDQYQHSLLGEVIGLGTGADNFKFETKVGDTVLLPQMHGADDIEVDGEPIIILSEANLLGILDEPAA